ncbi:hypothetical protein BN903_26 [Halorubrum sp. AJ67]|nr:hypothetical protein BN903_26 [Halorubrum sp. AJ67]
MNAGGCEQNLGSTGLKIVYCPSELRCPKAHTLFECKFI